MDDRKCPFCGGMLLDKICVDCGYEYLTEEEIAAPYDFEPENDHFGTEEAKADEFGMEGISLESLDGSVSAAAPQMASVGAAHTGSGIVPPKARQFQNPNSVPFNAQVNNFQANNAQVHTPPKYTPPPPPPMPVQQNVSVFEMMVKDFSAYIQKCWWQILLTFLIPTTGLFFGSYYISKIKRGGTVTDVAIGILYIVAFVILKASGFDLLGLDAILWTILQALPRRRRRYRYY